MVDRVVTNPPAPSRTGQSSPTQPSPVPSSVSRSNNAEGLPPGFFSEVGETPQPTPPAPAPPAPAPTTPDLEPPGAPSAPLPARPPGPPPKPGWVWDPSRGWLSPPVYQETRSYEQEAKKYYGGVDRATSGQSALAATRTREKLLEDYPINRATVPDTASRRAKVLAEIADAQKARAAQRAAGMKPYTINWWLTIQQRARAKEIPIEEAYEQATKEKPLFAIPAAERKPEPLPSVWVAPTEPEGYAGGVGTVIGGVERGKPVTVIGEKGQVTVPWDVYEAMSTATNPEAQFLLLRQAGVIGKGSEYVAGEREGTWSYIPEEEVKRREAGQAESRASQAEYDKWVEDFTSSQKATGYSDADIQRQIADIASGQYQVLDYETNQFYPTYREAVEGLEEMYQQFPEAGTSPGKVPLPQAIETRKAQYEAQQTTIQELRDKGLATEVGKLAIGEYGPEVPENLRWNYDLIGALDAGIDRSRLDDVFGVAAVADADRLRTALKGIEDYKTKDGYNIAKLVLDSEKNPELLRQAQIAFDSDEGRAMLAKYQEQIRPSDAWWYRTDTGEYKTISDKERQQIIKDKGEFYAEQRITRTTEGLGAAFQRLMMSPTLSPEFKPIETPSVDYMNRIADFDFFDKGGSVKERMALTDAMRRAGFIPSVAGFRLLPDDDKKKVVDEFEMGPTVSRLLEPVDKKVGEWLESVNEWRTEGTVSKPFRGVAAGGATLLSMLYSLPASGVKMVADTAEGYHKATLAEAAMLPIGMTEFLSVQLPKAIGTDPISGIPYAITVLAPHLLLKGGLRVVDTTFKYARGAVKPYRVTAGVTALEEPVPRTQLAGNMSPYDAIKLVSDVEKAWGGAGTVPINVRDILKVDPVAAAIFTGMTKGIDIKIKNVRGTIIGRVNPSQMGIENVLYSVSTSTEAIAKEMGKTGGKFAPEGVQWFSPNYSADILGWPQYLSREGYSPGGVMLRFSSKDVMPYPKDIWNKAVTPKNIEAVKAEYRRAGKEIPDRVTLMNDAVRNEILRRGSLPPGHPEAFPPGLYPLFKWHWSKEPSGRLAPTYELEWIAPRGTDIFGFKPSGRAYRLATGETALPEVATLTLDSPVGAMDKVTGQGVRVGQKLPVIVAATKAALAEGKGIPSVKDMMVIQMLYKPYVGLKNVFQPGRAVRPTAAAGEAFTTRKWYSRAVKLESPKVAAEVAATKGILDKVVKRRGQEPLSTPELARTLGAIVDKDGRITRTRDPHLHPEYDYSDNWVTSRVGVMLEHPTKKGSYIVFSDTAEPYGVYNMIGGQVDPMGTPRVPGRPKGRVSLEEAAREQMLSEVGVDLQQIRPARIHEGKTTEHSLYGTYMFDAKPSSLSFKVIKDAMGRYEVRDAITLSPGDKAVVTPALYIELYKRGFDVRNLMVADSHLPTAGIKQYPKGTPEYEIIRNAKKSPMTYDPKTRTYTGAPEIAKDKVIFSVPEAQAIKWPNPPARYVARGEIAAGMEGALPFRDIIGERIKTRYLAPVVASLGARERLVTGTDEALPTTISELRLSPPLEPEAVPISPEDLTVKPMIEPEPVPVVSDTTVRPVEGIREGMATAEPEPAMQAIEETTTPTPEEGTTPTPEEGTTPTPEEGTTPVPEERIVTGEETVTGVEKGKRILRPPTTSMAGLERVKIPEGSITFAWGKVLRGSGANRRKVPVWRYIPPPWTQSKPETLYAPPIGAKNIDSSNPYTTVQRIGKSGSVVPKTISIDLGVTDALISDYGKRIAFSGRGQDTDVGERLPSATKGMSIPASEEMFEITPKGRTFQRRGRAKPTKLSHYDYMTTLKGFKP